MRVRREKREKISTCQFKIQKIHCCTTVSKHTLVSRPITLLTSLELAFGLWIFCVAVVSSMNKFGNKSNNADNNYIPKYL